MKGHLREANHQIAWQVDQDIRLKQGEQKVIILLSLAIIQDVTNRLGVRAFGQAL
jgi:hypothetical protein